MKCGRAFGATVAFIVGLAMISIVGLFTADDPCGQVAVATRGESGNYRWVREFRRRLSGRRLRACADKHAVVRKVAVEITPGGFTQTDKKFERKNVVRSVVRNAGIPTHTPTHTPTDTPTNTPTITPTLSPTRSPTHTPNATVPNATVANARIANQCQVTVYEHWPEGITAGMPGLETAERMWNGSFPTGATMILTGTGDHPLGALSNLVSSVKVQGACCKAFGYTNALCSGTQGTPISSTTQILQSSQAGVVTPATGISSLWGCNDCAQCVKVTQQCP